MGDPQTAAGADDAALAVVVAFVITACKHATTLQLKAPSSAEFARSMSGLPNGKRVVTGYVDAQNSFGAKLRSDIRCEVYDEGANLRAFAHLTPR